MFLASEFLAAFVASYLADIVPFRIALFNRALDSGQCVITSDGKLEISGQTDGVFVIHRHFVGFTANISSVELNVEGVQNPLGLLHVRAGLYAARRAWFVAIAAAVLGALNRNHVAAVHGNRSRAVR